MQYYSVALRHLPAANLVPYSCYQAISRVGPSQLSLCQRRLLAIMRTIVTNNSHSEAHSQPVEDDRLEVYHTGGAPTA